MALIEAQAHIYGNFFSELGIGYQSNMKRERINSAEIGLMKGNLDLNVHNIIKTLQDGIEKVNKKFGTDISVDLNDEVFYVGSGNASLGEVNTDGELQVDGIEEPNIEQEEIEEKTKEEEAKADERD